jgi:hypothetical protein
MEAMMGWECGLDRTDDVCIENTCERIKRKRDIALKDTGCKNRKWVELRMVSNGGFFGTRGATPPSSSTTVLKVKLSL